MDSVVPAAGYPRSMSGIPDHYSPAELAEMLHLSVSMVKAKGYSGEWPCLKLGPRTIRFTEAHYQQIAELTENRSPAPTETPRERNKRLRVLLAAQPPGTHAG